MFKLTVNGMAQELKFSSSVVFVSLLTMQVTLLKVPNCQFEMWKRTQICAPDDRTLNTEKEYR